MVEATEQFDEAEQAYITEARAAAMKIVEVAFKKLPHNPYGELDKNEIIIQTTRGEGIFPKDDNSQ